MNLNCTVHKTADFLGKKWTIQILLEISKGKEKTRRYQEIKNDPFHQAKGA
jgi:DNA-binding HxlR family transcriptional regulator